MRAAIITSVVLLMTTMGDGEKMVPSDAPCVPPAVNLAPAERHEGAAVVPAVDQAMLEKVLKAIALVESGGKDVGVHPDKVSHGRYGMTMVACRELVRLGVIIEIPAEKELDDPHVCATLARWYLEEMYLCPKRGCRSWWHAVGWYHGGPKEKRDEYAMKVWGCL